MRVDAGFFPGGVAWTTMTEFAFLHFPAEAVKVDPVKFARLPMSAQRTFEAIREAGPLTSSQLRERTNIPGRTLRYAVGRLKEEGMLETRCSLRDCRTCYFFVSRRCVGVGALEEAQAAARAARPESGSPAV